ncbi:hypothetical protein N7476_004708 [Penicillium atrosanguineum]|uniref:Uncharacterized protein n=1 Tax=Penicillium atrosanguineum TaxID=1132637 RepID=A0A9W9PY01_9EURO|nr:hypothetical protein N7476_004708 [Penicillium atrosanguineum]
MMSDNIKDKVNNEEQDLRASEEEMGLDDSRAFPLSISPSYVNDWDTSAAFRELYQNWKDAILESFGLDRLEFQPTYEEQDDYISVIVPDVSSPGDCSRALGFIKYEKAEGRMIIAKACAQLPPESLQFGHSSKRKNTNLAGCHGEGLKLAALVMSRHGYSVNIDASNAHWNFSLKESGFYCQFWPFRGDNASSETDPAIDMAQLRSRTDRDVTVVIEASVGKQDKIPLALFHAWLRVSLDIRRFSYPTRIVETNAGDLIFDSDFCGQLYLKGMALPASFCELKPYKLGYNFPRGKVNRDRQILVDSHEEADLVRQIWEAAFQNHKQLLLPIYIDLLRNSPDAPDVGFAKHLLEKPTRTLIWKHLLDETEGRHFYYSEASSAQVSPLRAILLLIYINEIAQSIGMIRDVLKKEPRRLPGALWDLLRSASPIRTAEEEQIHCFKNSDLCIPPDTHFSWTIQRAIQACLTVFPQWKHITVHFVRSESIPMDVFYDSQPGILKVNQRWLHFDSTHGNTRCRDFTPNETSDHQGFFFCNHVIEDLLRTALPSLLGPPFGRKALENALLRKIRNILRFMPHNIKVMTTAMVGGLMITWEDNETQSVRNYTAPRCLYHVILHDENCPHGRTQLLHGAAGML